MDEDACTKRASFKYPRLYITTTKIDITLMTTTIKDVNEQGSKTHGRQNGFLLFFLRYRMAKSKLFTIKCGLWVSESMPPWRGSKSSLLRGRRFDRSSSDGKVQEEVIQKEPALDLPPAFRIFVRSKSQDERLRRSGKLVVARRSDGTKGVSGSVEPVKNRENEIGQASLTVYLIHWFEQITWSVVSSGHSK